MFAFLFLTFDEEKNVYFHVNFCLKKAADTSACTEGLRSILTAVCSIENGIVDEREISTWCVRMEWCVQKLCNCSKAIVIILFPIFNLSVLCMQFKKFFVCPFPYSACVPVPTYWITCWDFNKVAPEKSKRRLQEIQFGLHTNERKKKYLKILFDWANIGSTHSKINKLCSIHSMMKIELNASQRLNESDIHAFSLLWIQQTDLSIHIDGSEWLYHAYIVLYSNSVPLWTSIQYLFRSTSLPLPLTHSLTHYQYHSFAIKCLPLFRN